MVRRVVVLALCAAGCGSEDEIAIVYDPCSSLTVAVAGEPSAAERSGVEHAVELWSAALPAQLAIGAGPRAPDVLLVRFVGGDDVSYRAMYWDAQGVIEIHRERLAPSTYGVALAHEMGHAFGLFHVAAEERASIMNVGNVEIGPTPEDAAEVRALWPSCGL